MSRPNVWLSVSDLMTGLMVIFLFIAIAYISRVQQNQSVLTDYVETKNQLHQNLVKEFEGDTLKWQMAIGKDLSMKFKEPTVLFATGSYELTPRFKEILDEFLPRYFNILLNDSLKNDIQEIRIEGHTDNVPIPVLTLTLISLMSFFLNDALLVFYVICVLCRLIRIIPRSSVTSWNIGLLPMDFLMVRPLTITVSIFLNPATRLIKICRAVLSFASSPEEMKSLKTSLIKTPTNEL